MSRFSNWVTETAFSLQLTKAQISTLDSLATDGLILRNFNEKSLASLWFKGLIDRDDQNYYVLSEAGKLVYRLLKLANLTEKADKRIVTRLVREVIKEYGKPQNV